MPRGDKSSYSGKQKRKAAHIEKSYRERGVSEREAERRAWATVNAEDGGGKRKGAARRRSARNRAGARPRAARRRASGGRKRASPG